MRQQLSRHDNDEPAADGRGRGATRALGSALDEFGLGRGIVAVLASSSVRGLTDSGGRGEPNDSARLGFFLSVSL